MIILIGFHSCKKNVNPELTINGIWNSMGYGQQVHINDSLVVVYDIYKNGCALNSELPKEYFSQYFEVKELISDSLKLGLGFTDYHFVRSKSLCKTSEQYTINKNPLVNFDALWHTFNENYASFELRGVDWQKSKEKFRAKLTPESTDLELYKVLTEMLSELNDGHVSLDIPDSLENDIDEEEDDAVDELRELTINTINKRYLDDFKTYNKGIINWGIIDKNIGYIQINDFEDLANYNIDQNLQEEEFWDTYWEYAEKSENYSQDAINGIKTILLAIFNDIENTRSCIIDVRFNGGGFDQAGLEVLSYFTDAKTIAFSKKARFKDGFTKPQSIYIETNIQYYDKPIYVLTSYQTASASETFILATRNLINVKTIGSNTEGILSDILSKRLPNGWEYGLSNEVYESADGINYEKDGIPTDYHINYNRNPEDFYNNLLLELKTQDKVIEKVIQLKN